MITFFLTAYSKDRLYRTNGFVVEAKLERKAGFYLWNMFLPLGIIASLCFLTAVLASSEAGSRLGITVTLLLTAVAFKGTTSSLLPKISYLTYLDV